MPPKLSRIVATLFDYLEKPGKDIVFMNKVLYIMLLNLSDVDQVLIGIAS